MTYRSFFPRFIITLLCMIFAPLLYSAGNPEIGSDVITVAALRGPTAIGMVRLLERTEELSTGNGIAYSIVGTPDLMVSKILSGEIDAASLPLNLAANLYTKDVPYVLVAVTGNGAFYIVSRDEEIESLKDLTGKRVYNIGKGGNPEFILNHILVENELLEDIQVDYSFSHLEMAPQIVAGNVETAMLPEPFVTTVLQKGEDLDVVIDLQKEWSKIHGTASFPVSAFVVKREIAGKFSGALDEFLELYKNSIDWVNQNPESAGELARKHIGLPSNVVSQSVPRLNLSFEYAKAARKDIEAFLSVLFTSAPESIGGKMPNDDFYGR